MTVWNIHLLNARNALTGMLPEIRAAAREAVALVSAHADLPRFDLVVKAGHEVMPEWGLASQVPAPGLIEITLNPDRVAAALLLRRLVRDLGLAIRWERPGYGRGLGEALVSEGLAGHLVLQLLGGRPDPWDAVAPAPGLARRAQNEWARLDFDRGRWFQGKGDLRRWAGYGLGHRLIAEHLAQQPDSDAVALISTPAESFRAALRRLVGSDNATDTDQELVDQDGAPEGPDAAPDADAVEAVEAVIQDGDGSDSDDRDSPGGEAPPPQVT